MKPCLHVHACLFRNPALLLCLTIVGTTVAQVITAEEKPKAEPQPYTLYMGAEIKLQRGENDYYQVENVVGNSWVIRVKGKDVRVPQNRNQLTLKIHDVLRLSETSATIEMLQSEQVYTPEKDPRRKWMTAFASVEDMNTNAIQSANATLNRMPFSGGGMMGDKKASDMSPGEANPNEAADKAAMAQIEETQSTMAALNTGALERKMSEELALGLFDALEIKFEVSSEKPLNAPYIVLDVLFHEKGKPQPSLTLIHAEQIKPVGSKPTQVRLRPSGFPPGFELEKIKVHLYDQGTEVATNVSPKRVQLSRDEAHEYLVVEYISKHKGKTVGPTLALARLPDDWAARSKGDSFKKTYFLKLDVAGQPTGVFEDKSCTVEPNDAYIKQVLSGLRFLPALTLGKPTESIIQLQSAVLSK